MSSLAAKCRQYAMWIRAWDAYEPGKPEVPQAINYQVEAQTFDDAADEIARLRAALKECADDLANEIEGRFNSVGRHPGMKRRYDRDMVPVNNARALLGQLHEEHDQ